MMTRHGILGVVLILATAVPAAGQGLRTGWGLAPGLELERYDSVTRQGSSTGDVHVLRIDPLRWELAVLAGGQKNDAPRRSLGRWGRDHELEAAINAGMYQADGVTHVGFCMVDGVVLNGSANDYLSAFVCDPVDDEDPVFSIVDLDEVPLSELRERYRTVVQNLRLIKHTGENRWSPTSDRWREAALAQDGRGRALFVLCTRPLSMHDFNELLLSLPLDVVAAQHLEGNKAAGLWVRMTPSGYGSSIAASATVPNVLAVRPLIDESDKEATTE